MISVHELKKTFETATRTIRAVDGVSFTVAPSEVFGLLGPNGAGKTTVIRMILGLLKPDSGYAEIDGINSRDAPDDLKRMIGFVSASAGVYQWLSGREMLSFFGEVYGLGESEIVGRIEALEKILDLTPFLDQGCATLSTGQKQRLSLARALIHDPPVMMLDEPTLGLDVIGSQVIFDYIRLLRERNKAIILCTHRLEQAQRVCTRFGLLHQGRKVHDGSLEELRTRTGHNDLVEMFVDLLSEESNQDPAGTSQARASV